MTRRLAAASFSSALCLSAAWNASAQSQPPDEQQQPAAEGERDLPPPYPPPSTRWKLMAAGVATTGVWYGAATGFSYLFPDAPGAADLRVPVIGPWKAIANNGCPADEPDCSQVMVILRTVLTALDGIGQAGGIGLFVESIFIPTESRSSELRDRREGPAPGPAPRPTTPKPTKPTDDKNLFWAPTPFVASSGAVGIGFVGKF